MKRILALDGGGLRGVVEVAYLERLEALLRKRRGAEVRLGDTFHLAGGTSTGAIIATGIALGFTMAEIKAFYFERAQKVFRPGRVRAFGFIPSYNGAALEQEFRRIVGDRTLGDGDFRCLLALVLKRVDTGAPWIVSTLPDAPYFADPPDGSYIGNRHYEIAKLLRASTSAPGYFGPSCLRIMEDGPEGIFVDGGISPYNDPSQALLMLATMRAFGLEWPTGPDDLAIVSIGTGHSRRRITGQTARRSLPLALAGMTLLGMLKDTERHSLTMMQWLGRPLLPQVINSEIGDMTGEALTPEPLFTHLRLDFPLDVEGTQTLGASYTEAEILRLRRLDNVKAIPDLYALGQAAADQQITPAILDALGL